jgi:OmpA-OmpF porin, OOP family
MKPYIATITLYSPHLNHRRFKTMSINLVELAQGALSNPAVLSAASSFLGESESKTSSGMSAAIPAILGGLMSKAGQSGGGELISGLLGAQEPSLLDNVAGLFGGGESSNNALGLGGNILKMVMGDKLGGVVDLITSVSGLGKGSAGNLLSMAAPVVLGLLGKHGGGSVSGITNLLGGQGDFLKAAAPAGLGSLLGLGGLGSVAANAFSGAKDSVGNAAGAAANFAGDSVEAGGGLLRKILPFLLLGALALAALWLFRSCQKGGVTGAVSDATGAVTGAAGNAAGAVKDAAGNAVDAAGNAAGAVGAAADSLGNAAGNAAGAVAGAAGNAVAALGEFFKFKLPNGVELNIPQNGVENKLATFIGDANKAVDKTTWFNFDRLLFDTGKATLQPTSQEQVKNIAEILKAYPNVNIKLGGYTDNVGDDKMNLDLSAARAATVKAELEKLGVPAGRVESEGYGEQHPVASNDTEEGRQQNRRIAVRVTKK